MAAERSLPKTASVADDIGNGRLFAASAERNATAIEDALRDHLPDRGRALEIASGTGQHIAQFAKRFGNIEWHPSDVSPERLVSIFSYVDEANLANLRAPISLDATEKGWSQAHQGFDVILLVNLLHLISEEEANTLIQEAAHALAQGGKLFLYGPFMRAGELTSEGDHSFHESLVNADPEIGYKDDFDTLDMLNEAWLEPVEIIEMPANNLIIIARK
jgi:SAM-dependent methyltransferase